VAIAGFAKKFVTILESFQERFTTFLSGGDKIHLMPAMAQGFRDEDVAVPACGITNTFTRRNAEFFGGIDVESK
jgi:hypothetical protein